MPTPGMWRQEVSSDRDWPAGTRRRSGRLQRLLLLLVPAYRRASRRQSKKLRQHSAASIAALFRLDMVLTNAEKDTTDMNGVGATLAGNRVASTPCICHQQFVFGQPVR
jgi:hypothetical protein